MSVKKILSSFYLSFIIRYEKGRAMKKDTMLNRPEIKGFLRISSHFSEVSVKKILSSFYLSFMIRYEKGRAMKKDTVFNRPEIKGFSIISGKGFMV